MKKVFIIIILLLLVGCSFNPKYQTDNNVYTLQVYLDESNDSLTVEGEIYFKNDNYDLDELYLTVYPNAVNPSNREYNVDFEYIKVADEIVEYVVKGEDDTQIYIELEETLKKGKNIIIQFKYEFDYWSDGRLAHYEDSYLTMFFYPFVAMYDDEGWNIDPFTFRGESYYNEVGDYYVTINVPSDYKIATSGELINSNEIDERLINQYIVKNARDYSFSTSPNYWLYDFTVEERNYSIYSIRELTSNEVQLARITIENTFRYFETEIGEYPYNHFVLELGYYYGMESTGVIYCSEDISEGTIAHEIIHQWFYSMVGNDQSDESYLDESLTTFMASLYYYKSYGIEGYNDYLDYRSSLQTKYADRYLASIGESLLQKVDEFGSMYAYLIYYHGPSMFRYYIEEFLDGDIELFYDIISKYFDEYKFKIATLDDLLDMIELESSVVETKEWFMMQIQEFQDFDNRPN